MALSSIAVKTKSKDKLKSVEKALQILGAFSIEKPELSISDLVEIMHIPRVSGENIIGGA